jgi:hypothetical protein
VVVLWLWVVAAAAFPRATPGADTGLNAAVATVNGEAVTARELVESMRRLRTRHADPAELRNAALAACVRFAVTLQLARDHELLGDVTDAGLRQAFAVENRADAEEGGTVFYGPRRLSWEQFRAVWLDRLERDFGRSLLAAQNDNHIKPIRPHEELRVLEHAVDQAVSRAHVQADAAALAGLAVDTPLPPAQAAGSTTGSGATP